MTVMTVKIAMMIKRRLLPRRKKVATTAMAVMIATMNLQSRKPKNRAMTMTC